MFVVVSGALISRMLADKTAAPAPVAVVPEENLNATMNEYSNPNLDNVPETVSTTGHDVVNTKSIEFLRAPEKYDAKDISKRLGLKISALAEKTSRDASKNYSGAYSLVFTKLGAVSGQELYDIAQSCVSVSGPDDDMMAELAYVPDGCQNFDVLAKYDPSKKKFFIYSKHSSGAADSYRDIPALFPKPLEAYAVRTDEMISDLILPASVTLPYGYALSPSFPALMLTGIPDSAGGSSLVKYAFVGTSLEGYNIYQESSTSDVYYMKVEGFGYGQYALKIPFYANGRVPQITWNDGSKNDTDYSPFAWRSGNGPFDGFGDMNTLPSNESASFYERFTPAGKCSNGEYAYVPKSDTDHILNDYPFLTENSQTGESAGPKFFLTKNPFDRIIIWTKTELLPMAERGKPVIYLYPKHAEKISVKLGNEVEVLKSEPEYKGGWTVTAQPDGKLADATGSYPYLYWDGNSPAYKTPEQGWAVASSDVEHFFATKLRELGLSAKETADFLEFWLPIVTKSPYALISFVPQEEWSKAAPLSISPAPDTVIRIFMDWKPLSEPINVAPQTLPPTPKRTGFTAVEWGGLLYR